MIDRYWSIWNFSAYLLRFAPGQVSPGYPGMLESKNKLKDMADKRPWHPKYLTANTMPKMMLMLKSTTLARSTGTRRFKTVRQYLCYYAAAAADQSRGTASIRSTAASAFTRISSATLTSGFMVSKAWITSSKVVSFISGQSMAREIW